MNEGDDDISVDKNEDSAVLASPEVLETSFFINKPKKDEVAAVEGVLVYHGVKHGHSHLEQQCTTNVCKAIFSSSSIANDLPCARTKSTFIALNVLTSFFTYGLLDDLKQLLYYFLIDELSCIIKKIVIVNILHNSVKHANNSLSIDIEQILLMKKNLELQHSYTTAVDLFSIITSVRTKLQE
ncbi:unnamed protein product [Rotaria sp. Silwood1]|nr:unnamed protein product [Rotaria sp. Silwood1]